MHHYGAMNASELRAARKSKSMSVQMVADLIGVHRNSVVRWEKGAVIPGPAQLSLRWILAPDAEPPALRLAPRRKAQAQTEKSTAA